MQPIDSRRSRRPLRTRSQRAAMLFTLAVALTGASPATADEYDSKRSGHPLRIAAYVLHPIGFVVDALIFKPAHWVAHYGPLKRLFGHTD